MFNLIPWQPQNTNLRTNMFDKIDLNGNKIISLSEMTCELRTYLKLTKEELNNQMIKKAYY